MVMGVKASLLDSVAGGCRLGLGFVPLRGCVGGHNPRYNGSGWV